MIKVLVAGLHKCSYKCHYEQNCISEGNRKSGIKNTSSTPKINFHRELIMFFTSFLSNFSASQQKLSDPSPRKLQPTGKSEREI